MKSDKALAALIEKTFGSAFCSQAASDLKSYGTDWTRRFEPKASLICFPSTTAEVAALLRLCSEHEIKVVPSGGRTGLAAGAVATQGELVLSLQRMSRIISFHPGHARVRVQAGVIHQTLQEHVGTENLMWPIDLASKGSSQIGGNIATNAGGLRVLRYGHCRAWVQSLQVVLADGSIYEFSGDLEKNNTGYDLRQLFIGSEGTLGVITEATLMLVPRPEDSQVLLFAVDELAAAQELLARARQSHLPLLSAEFFSARCLEAVMERQNLSQPFEKKYRYYGLLEIDTTGADAKNGIEKFANALNDSKLVLDATLGTDKSQNRGLWAYRETITESLSQMGAVYKNDLSLPLEKLPPYVEWVASRPEIQKAGAEVYLFGHFGDGNVHVNIVKAGAAGEVAEEFYKFCEALNHVLFTELKKQGGSIAAEHGVGLLKKDYLEYTRPKEEIAIMKSIKRVFDPKGILNPGKIFDL